MSGTDIRTVFPASADFVANGKAALRAAGPDPAGDLGVWHAMPGPHMRSCGSRKRLFAPACSPAPEQRCSSSSSLTWRISSLRHQVLLLSSALAMLPSCASAMQSPILTEHSHGPAAQPVVLPLNSHPSSGTDSSYALSGTVQHHCLRALVLITRVLRPGAGICRCTREGGSKASGFTHRARTHMCGFLFSLSEAAAALQWLFSMLFRFKTDARCGTGRCLISYGTCSM